MYKALSLLFPNNSRAARTMYLFSPLVNGPCLAKRMEIFTDVARWAHCVYSGAGWVCFGTERVCYEETALYLIV